MNKKRILEFFKRKNVVIGTVSSIIGFSVIVGGVGIYKHIQNNKVLSETKADENKDALTSNENDKNKPNEEKNIYNNDSKETQVKDEPKKDDKEKNTNENKNKKDNKNNTDNRIENVKTEQKNENKTSVSKVNNKPIEHNNNAINNEQSKHENSNQQNHNENSKQPKHKNNVQPRQEEQTGLAGEIARTKIAQRTNQIILVSGNELSLWNKSNGKWNEAFETSARLGYGGLTSNKHEGDGATPVGVYPILYSFGFGSNPGTSLEYKRIDKNSYFVDDSNSKYYNQWYEGTGQKGEHMIDHAQYKYGMVIGYNTGHTPGKGSAIFLHCNGRGNTAGCISVSEGNMLRLLKSTHEGAYIIITSSNSNLKYY